MVDSIFPIGPIFSNNLINQVNSIATTSALGSSPIPRLDNTDVISISNNSVNQVLATVPFKSALTLESVDGAVNILQLQRALLDRVDAEDLTIPEKQFLDDGVVQAVATFDFIESETQALTADEQIVIADVLFTFSAASGTDDITQSNQIIIDTTVGGDGETAQGRADIIANVINAANDTNSNLNLHSDTIASLQGIKAIINDSENGDSQLIIASNNNLEVATLDEVSFADNIELNGVEQNLGTSFGGLVIDFSDINGSIVEGEFELAGKTFNFDNTSDIANSSAAGAIKLNSTGQENDPIVLRDNASDAIDDLLTIINSKLDVSNTNVAEIDDDYIYNSYSAQRVGDKILITSDVYNQTVLNVSQPIKDNTAQENLVSFLYNNLEAQSDPGQQVVSTSVYNNRIDYDIEVKEADIIDVNTANINATQHLFSNLQDRALPIKEEIIIPQVLNNLILEKSINDVKVIQKTIKYIESNFQIIIDNPKEVNVVEEVEAEDSKSSIVTVSIAVAQSQIGLQVGAGISAIPNSPNTLYITPLDGKKITNTTASKYSSSTKR